MRGVFNCLLSYILIFSGISFPASSSHALGTMQYGGMMFQSDDHEEYRLTEKNFRFIVHFKAYVNALLRLQAAEVKKKLVCLGHSDLANLRFDDLEDKDLAKELKEAFLDYRNTPECEEFRTERVKTLTKMYRDMKVYLGLHRSSSYEVKRKLLHSNIEGAADRGFIDLLSCEKIRTPLMYDRTDFCLGRLMSIVNIKPVHIIKKISISFLDELFDAEKLPEVSPVTPLTWREVQMSTELFQEKFINNKANFSEMTKEVMKDMNIDDEFFEEEKVEQEKDKDNSVGFIGFYGETKRKGPYYDKNKENKVILEKYFSAVDFQAHGMHIFSNYPKESAPKIYSDIIAKEPVLAFFEPEMKKIELDCEHIELNMHEICNQYLNYLDGHAYTYVQSYDSIVNQLAQAYKKILTFNELLIKSFNMTYDSSTILTEDLKIRTDLDSEKVENWRKLVKLEKAMDSFFEMYPDFEGGEEQFKNIQRSEEIRWLVVTLASIIGLSIACGFIGNYVGAVTCLAASGIGANLYFYQHSLKTHAQMMKQFFSNPGETADGLKLDLVSFDQMKMEDQGLVIEVAFVAVGTSIGPIIKRTRKALSDLRAK